MASKFFESRGQSLEKQQFTWREIVQQPFSKLNDDAFSRVRSILMNGIEFESVMFQHMLARASRDLRPHLARVRQVEQHQQKAVNWMLPPDQSPLETTIGYEQVAVEVTASIAQNEPDPYLAQVYRFGLLEDFDHLYRYSALLDRLEGKDANNILQSYTDILPGRPTIEEHRAALDNLRRPYDRRKAAPISKINVCLITAAEQQTENYYLNVGPLFSDPVARQLYAEIASIEEQHVTQYESLMDPDETVLEKWLLHEATEVYTYRSCLESESDPRLKKLWDRFHDYELGHLHYVMELFKSIENRDPAEVLPEKLPKLLNFGNHRSYVRSVLDAEADLRTNGMDIVKREDENPESIAYRNQVNREGSPSQAVAAGYRWIPGTELNQKIA